MFEPGSFPHDFVRACCAYLKDQKLIHRGYVARVLLAARNCFTGIASLMEIEIPTESP
jgi:PPP5 TPR repeat region